MLVSGVACAQDIPVNPNLVWNGESNLAVNPADSNNLITAWMKLTGVGRVSIAVAFSFDGGMTWSTPILMPHFYAASTSADPTLSFRSDGKIFLAYIDYDHNLDSGAVYVASSADGGLTWTAPSEAINGFASADLPVDRPWLVVDNSPTPSWGTLHLITKSYKDAPFPHAIWHIQSPDSGATWTAPVQVDDSIPIGPSTSSMGVPAVDATGRLNILYLSFNPAQFLLPRYVLAQSSGAATFAYQTVTTLPANAFFAATDTLYQYSYHLAAHPMNSGNLIACWTDNRNGDPDIYSVQTNDSGATWSVPLQVNDDATGAGVGQDMCWAGFSRQGTYAIAWRDRRAGGSGQLADYRIYTSASTDGGISFSPNAGVSALAGPLFVPVDGNDFIGVTLTDSRVHCTWTDRRTTRNQLYYRSLPMDSILLATQNLAISADGMVFPNPVVDLLYLDLPCGAVSTAWLADLTGKRVGWLEPAPGTASGPCRFFMPHADAGLYVVVAVLRNGRQPLRTLLIKTQD